MLRILFLCWSLLVGSIAAAAGVDDLLEPEKAFRMTAQALDARTVEVRFRIADGYYMYRERFRFAVAPGAKATLGMPEFPQGVRKKDEFFGEMETYRGEIAIRIPVETTEASVPLLVTSQGCADAGVCYVPMDSKATVQLAGFSAPPAGAPAALESPPRRPHCPSAASTCASRSGR